MFRKSVGVRFRLGLVVVPPVVDVAGRIVESAGVVVAMVDDMENDSADAKRPDQKSNAVICPPASVAPATREIGANGVVAARNREISPQKSDRPPAAADNGLRPKPRRRKGAKTQRNSKEANRHPESLRTYS